MHLQRPFLLAALGAASLALGACSSSSRGGASDAGLPPPVHDAGPLTARRACADFAAARCAKLALCSQVRISIAFGDVAGCEAAVAGTCEASVAAPSSGDTPLTVEACAAAYPSWACNELLDETDIPGACWQRTGGLPVGAPCALAAQCTTGYCAIVPGQACGACAATPKVGDSCAALSACGQGLVCAGDTQTCAAYAGPGGVCGRGAPCGANDSCVGSQPARGVPGTCETEAIGEGMACDSTTTTAAACNRDRGLSCNAATSKCAPVVLVSVGQPCGQVGDQPATCQGGAACDVPVAGSPGTCVAASGAGGPCVALGLPACAPGLRCTGAGDGGTGVCALPSAAACH